MYAVLVPWRRRLALLTLLCLLSSFVPSAIAQEPTPPDPMTPQPYDANVYGSFVTGDGVSVLAETPSAEAVEISASERSASPDPTPVEADSPPPIAVEPQTLTITSGPEATNDVKVDVSAPGSVMAGQTIDYTYAYTNTKSTPFDIVLQVVWTDFSLSVNGNVQFCVGSGPEAGCAPIAQSGPTVTKVTTIPTGSCPTGRVCYMASGLAGNSAGKFSVRLGISKDKYPRSNETPRRPASSVQLFIGSELTVTSEDTASTLIVGPVLVVTKSNADSSKKIYATKSYNPSSNEFGEFIIKIGNATGSQDSANGQPRADARDATNIVLVDKFPNGGAYIDSTPAGTVDANAKTVTWTFPGPLKPGQTLPEVRVRFRKADEDNNCERLNNDSYSATSDEYPINSTTRYAVAGPGVGIDVVVPLKIDSITAVPSNVYFGDEADIAITVRNYFNQAVNDIQLNYDIQSNATYAFANPSPIAAPPNSTPPGRVSWKFSMPAGSKTTPTQQAFTVHVQGGYFKDGVTGGTASLVVPAASNPDLPTACIKTKDGRANLVPRLRVEKRTDTDPTTIVNGSYIVRNGQQFEYYITVENRGSHDAGDVDVSDKFPLNQGANFSYVTGSSTIDGSPRAPDQFLNGLGGNILWSNLQVPAGTKLTIRYKLVVNGNDYVQYCNRVSATSGLNADEPVEYGNSQVCVKISPNIQVTKTIKTSSGEVTSATANPGDTVTFRLTITNNEGQTYRVGLADKLNEFQYISMESGYDTSPDTSISGYLSWALVDLAQGQTREVVFKAKVPDTCQSKTYENEALFHNDQGNNIQPSPNVKAKVQVTCGKVEFRKGSSADKVSLQDKFQYELRIKNTDSKQITNVLVEDVMPQGFAYVAMDPGSQITSAPVTATLKDGRLQLQWTLPAIDAGKETLIRYIARSGIVVGKADNANANLVRSVPGVCPGSCASYDKDTSDNLSADQYTYKAVEVAPLITVEPQVTPAGCAVPGDKRTYQVTIVNTNSHNYTNSTVAVTLPLGLDYVRTITGTTSPSISINNDGGKTLRWSNLNVQAKPSNALAFQMLFQVELQVGNVWGDLQTLVQATSPDGAIPRKDGVIDPVIPVCPSRPAIAKSVDRSSAEAGQQVTYQISIANPTDQDIANVTVEDQLPSGVSFVQQTQGTAPTQNAGKLSWSMTVPKAGGATKPGVVILRFKAQLPANASKGTEYVNTATASGSGVTFDTTYNTAKVKIVTIQKYYMPLIGRPQ